MGTQISHTHWLSLALAAALMSTPAVAAKEPVAVSAPTKPVASKNLETPVFQSDTRNLQAIVDKDQEVLDMSENVPVETVPSVSVKAVAAPKPSPVVDASKVKVEKIEKIEKADEEEHFIPQILTGIRVFAIRWRDVFDIVFVIAVAIFTRKLYTVTRDQYKILAHSVRAAEDAAHAAKRSAEVVATLIKNVERHDEAQGQLNLD